MKSKIYIVLFMGFLSMIGVLFVALPKEKISHLEQKKLAQFPQFSTSALASGAYMDSIDIYLTDHFPMRYAFLQVADALERNKGVQFGEEEIYTNVEATDPIVQEENTVIEKDSIFGDNEQRNNSKGLLVSRGQALQIFTNEKPQTARFAETLFHYKQKLNANVRVFCLIAPTAGAYLMPKQYQTYQRKEQENLLELEQKLGSQFIFVPVVDDLEAHKSEYIFFRTDHHWTGLGAYYAYRSFCQKAGLTPIQLAEMTKKYVEGAFLGTHYLKTRNTSLENNPDTVFYWEVNGEHKATKTEAGVTSEASIVQLKNIESNRYVVFLGGDHPLMHLRSGLVQNGKKILVLKNSYGNSFVSYLLANYEQIWVVDYRYFKGSVTNIMLQNKIDDFIFISGVFAANEPSHIKKIDKVR